MTTFEFTGFGNFNRSSGWDSGLKCTLGDATTLKDARQTVGDKNRYYRLPNTPQAGVYFKLGFHKDSRRVHGYVIAESEDAAIAALREFDETFPKQLMQIKPAKKTYFVMVEKHGTPIRLEVVANNREEAKKIIAKHGFKITGNVQEGE